MAPTPARERKKFVTKSSGIGKTLAKEPEKSVAKKSKKSFSKKTVTKRTVAEKPKKNVQSSGWEKPASKRNLDPSGSMLRSKCHFFKLPLELRFMIYSDLIKSQDVAFLVTCQRIYNEALAIVYRDGTYIVEEYGQGGQQRYVYGGRRGAANYKREPIGDEFQNVEIWTELSNFVIRSGIYDGADYLGDHYPELKNPEISRKDCWMHLYGHRDLLEESHLEERLAIMLRTLRAFDNVFVNITEVTRLSDSFRPWKPVSEFESWFKSLGKSLEPSSGPSTWQDSADKENQFWVFHPRRERQRG